MSQMVRVRFAPSPTGALHIGGVRTALFNYLFAKKHGGTFYLRIEDTDQTRFVEGAEKYIFEALEWLGIAPDETIGKNEKFGPYRQSERKGIYKKYALELVEKGFAYYAFDTSEQLDTLRKNSESKGETFIYNHQTRDRLNNSLNLSSDELQHRLSTQVPYVIRFKTPSNKLLVVNDLIRGEVTFNTSLLDDKVLFKSDGMPTYHLANIVDDYLQQTTHVIRGEEWLPSLPLHFMLYEAFGWQVPQFAHLPLILKPVGNGKLSKRDGDKLGFPVFPLQWKSADGAISSGYRENGFFPEAVVNFLALLGWNDATDKEIYSLQELVENFDISRVNKSGAKFDPEKNKWFNHQYLIQKSDAELARLFQKELQEKEIHATLDYIEKIVSLIKPRATFVNEFYTLSKFFFNSPKSLDKAATKKWDTQTLETLKELLDFFKTQNVFSSEILQQNTKSWMAQKQLAMGKVMQPLRVCLVGEMSGPDVFEIASLLGKETVCNRLEFAIKQF